MKDTGVSLHFEHRNSYLYVKLTGKDSYDESIAYWTKIAKKTRALGLSSVLVHEELEGQITEGEIFQLLMELVPTAIGIRVALFDEHQADLEVNKLGSLIANNRGCEIRIFQSLEDAEAWIISG